MQTTNKQPKGYKGIAMEGGIARWYARLRRSGSQIEEWRKQATQLTNGLPDGADILEIAPGPGYFSIEMARLGRFHVTGMDISSTFIEIATENARREGMNITFRHGDASNMPFADETFDMVICQAAFKNFSRPLEAINEMYRVLRSGGTAVIQDMWREASNATIREEVGRMQLGPLNAFMARQSLLALRRRSYTKGQIENLARESSFGKCEIVIGGIGMEIRLKK